jgi:L-asparaginase/Glu-tRNA(Gln) amidotransferase subunit D
MRFQVASILILLSVPAAPASGFAADATRSLPVVWVLATGGTISGKGAASTSVTEYSAGAFLGEELVAAVPEIQQVAEVRAEQIANVRSSDLTWTTGSLWRSESTKFFPRIRLLLAWS